MYPLVVPPELSDQIIDHLHDDNATLLSTSLVCSTWLRESRYHLFRHVVIYAERAHDKAFAGKPKHWAPKKDYRLFCDAMRSLPDIASCVRHLTIQGNMVPIDRIIHREFMHNFVDMNYVLALLAVLPRLRTLEIRDVRLSYATPIPHSERPKLETLIIDDIDHAESQNVPFEIMDHFSHIERCRLGRNIRTIEWTDGPPPYQILATGLRELEIEHGVEAEWILNTVSTMFTPPTGGIFGPCACIKPHFPLDLVPTWR